jgi:NADH:ubiquinone oxidoreductase subunit E
MTVNVETQNVKATIARYGNEKKALIAILQDIQAEYNYLPPVALAVVSQTLDIPMIDIIGVATFYKSFSLEPKGEHQITVCVGTACHVRGAKKILAEFERKLGIEAGQTTEDGKFSLDKVACLGCCAIGPVVVADNEYHAQTTVRKVDQILLGIENKRAAQ